MTALHWLLSPGVSHLTLDKVVMSQHPDVQLEHVGCHAGSWFEFGVWEGATLNGVAEYRRVNCDDRPASNFVYGFDTFTGLPEAWGEFRPSVRCSWRSHLHISKAHCSVFYQDKSQFVGMNLSSSGYATSLCDRKSKTERPVLYMLGHDRGLRLML